MTQDVDTESIPEAVPKRAMLFLTWKLLGLVSIYFYTKGLNI